MEISLIISIVAVVSTVIVVLVVLTVLYDRTRSSRRDYYDHLNQKAKIDEIRLRLERQSYDLENRLISTDERWKDIQHLLLSSQKRQPDDLKQSKAPQISEFLRNLGLGDNDLIVDNELVFVLTPFHKDKLMTFNTIVEVCREVGLRCLRGDEEYIRGELLPHIIKQLVKARLVIANIEGRNPNVLYELGIAHAIDKPTILISKSPIKAPFDVKAKHLLIYTDLPSLKRRLKLALTKALVKV